MNSEAAEPFGEDRTCRSDQQHFGLVGSP
jgi:hypothetical protein